MIVRKADENDIEDIMNIVAAARAYFRENGIDQWQGEYPSRELFSSDIARGELYVCSEDVTVGVCAIVEGDEPSYHNVVEGSWLNERDYIAVHRIAVSPECKGKGVAGAFIKKAIEIALSRGLSDIRCDTHADNRNMRRMLEKNGFAFCCVVTLCDDGAERVGYQMRFDTVEVSNVQ